MLGELDELHGVADGGTAIAVHQPNPVCIQSLRRRMGGNEVRPRGSAGKGGAFSIIRGACFGLAEGRVPSPSQHPVSAHPARVKWGRRALVEGALASSSGRLAGAGPGGETLQAESGVQEQPPP